MCKYIIPDKKALEGLGIPAYNWAYVHLAGDRS